MRDGRRSQLAFALLYLPSPATVAERSTSYQLTFSSDSQQKPDTVHIVKRAVGQFTSVFLGQRAKFQNSVLRSTSHIGLACFLIVLHFFPPVLASPARMQPPHDTHCGGTLQCSVWRLSLAVHPLRHLAHNQQLAQLSTSTICDPAENTLQNKKNASG